MHHISYQDSYKKNIYLPTQCIRKTRISKRCFLLISLVTSRYIFNIYNLFTTGIKIIISLLNRTQTYLRTTYAQIMQT